MPLLLTPAAPLLTTSLLEVTQVYAIINQFTLDRPTRTATFAMGYYAHEAASLPESGAAQLSVSLPNMFSFAVDLARIGQMGDPTGVLEAYATHELLPRLGAGASITPVA